MIITHQQQRVLEALACFQYLTVKHMLRLGLSKSANSLRQHTLKRMTESQLIKGHDFNFIPKEGKPFRVHYLTPKGVEVLAESLRLDINDIEYPKGGVQFSIDYQHRMNFIDFHIAFRHWAEITTRDIEFVDSYFDKIGSQRGGNVHSTAKTRVQLNGKAFIPDGITRYQDGKKSRLVVIEIHNGTNTKRIRDQLLDHLTTITKGLISDKYGHEFANFVWSVHERESTLKSVKKQMNELFEDERFSYFKPLFLFNSQAQVQDNFAQGWTLADGRKTALFP